MVRFLLQMLNSRTRMLLILALIVGATVMMTMYPREVSAPAPVPPALSSEVPRVDVFQDIVLQHPRGDKGPEEAATKLLEQLDSPECFALIKPLYEEGAHRVCAFEEQFPDSRFKLIVRGDGPERSTLLYEADRKEFPGRIELRVYKRGDAWQVESLKASY